MSVAIVGSGLAGFTAYQALRRGGLDPGEIAVFGTDDDPAATWRVRAAAIRQREMRSESDGHCRPTTFPGLAFSSVLRRRSVRPLVDAVCDRYHPTVEEFLAHVARRRERSGWDRSIRAARVGRIGFRREDGHVLDSRATKCQVRNEAAQPAADDRDPLHYFTEPASSPWTK
jgi:cation diffusion facilitator CzcD-associated flavoprotein CzcO